MHDDLSIYVLPGRVSDALDGVSEARAAEAAGFGRVYVSERLDVKEAAVTCGAIAAATKDVGIGTALIHQSTRHPLAIAAMAATLQTMSGDRFALGIGRGLGALASSLGAPAPRLAGIEHLQSILRRLWAGERITEEGPAGSFRGLRFSDLPSGPPPPLLFGTIGPKGLALAGRCFDGVILHPLLTVEAVDRSVEIVRRSADEAGRDPASVRVVATLVSAPDLTPQREDIAVRARAISYLQVRGLGELIADWNGWDHGVLARLRDHPTLRGKGIADTALGRHQLVQSAEALPDEWFATGTAVGSVDHCLARARQYRAAGADEILLHGVLSTEAESMAARWGTDR